MEAICNLTDIAECAAREFSYLERGEKRRGFVVRQENRVFAYQNACPHTGVTLNWMPDAFLDVDKRLIMCTVHGALFRIQDGYCVRGPCAGDSLRPLRITVENGTVAVAGNR